LQVTSSVYSTSCIWAVRSHVLLSKSSVSFTFCFRLHLWYSHVHVLLCCFRDWKLWCWKIWLHTLRLKPRLAA